MIKVKKITKGEIVLAQNTKDTLCGKELCKGCGICVAFCQNVLVLKDGKVVIENRDACIQCGQCELRCPDYAIYLGGK